MEKLQLVSFSLPEGMIAANKIIVTIEDLQACDPEGRHVQVDASAAIRRKLEKLSLEHVRALFATRKLAFSTGMIMAVWGFIGTSPLLDLISTPFLLIENTGLGFPLYNAFLPYIQATRNAEFGDPSTYLTYRNSAIIASLGVPGALL